MSMDAVEYFHYLARSSNLLLSVGFCGLVWGFALMYAAGFFKGRRGSSWFWAGFFFGPIAAICLLFASHVDKERPQYG